METPRDHVPVLLGEVIARLALRPDDDAIDCTYGGGGYAEAMLREIAPSGKLLALDRDPSVAAASVSDRLLLVHGSFDALAAIAQEYGFAAPRAIVADLGLSSLQLADPQRGFSFQHDAPLDMRFDPSGDAPTAADFLRTADPIAIERIIRTYGEDRHARTIASAIVAERKRTPIATTAQLVSLIGRIIPRRGKIHPATRTFQALRIAVNDELPTLERAIPQMLDLVQPGGRVAIVAFHSLENRIVKQAFRNAVAQHQGTLVTPKPIAPTPEEIMQNPRSRSAKLRVFERTR